LQAGVASFRRRAHSACPTLWGIGFWLLLLTGPLYAQEQQIGCGQTATGNLNSAGQINTYAFNANDGESVTLLMLSQTFSSTADVYDPSGARISGATNNFTGPLMLAMTGTYTVRVHAANGTSTGAYGLSLTFLTGRCGPTLVWGPSTAGAVAFLAEVDSYTFSGNAGEAVSLNISSTNMTTAAFVSSPSGVILANWANGTSSINLTQTGTYTVGIYSYYMGGAGSYSASLVFTRLTPASFRLAIGTTNGATLLTLWGQVGRTTTLQYSSDLGGAAWSRLTNFSLPWSPYRFVDESSVNLPVRFYRTVQ
jgi:hypothetical protein